MSSTVDPSVGPTVATFHPIKPAHKSGYIVIVVFASLSAFALSFIALRALWLVLSPMFKRNSNGIVSKEQIFFRTQLGHYAVCLLASNFFTSAAGVVVSVWVAMDGIHPGEEWLCTVQAILMQIGNFATAYFTVAVACHTMNSLVFRLNQTAWVGAIVMAMGWVSSIIMGVAPLKISSPDSGLAYGFDGFSCGIKYTFPVPHFLLHLLPIFIAAITSVLIYSLIFLALRGTLVVKGGLKIVLDPKQRCDLDQYHRFISTIAQSMLWYPFAYTILLLPYSITKLLEISGCSVAFGGNVFAYTCSFMLGLVNVCLLYNTFRVLEPAFEARCTTSDMRKTDIEYFGDSSETIMPCHVAVTPGSVRTYGESFLPSWHPSTSDSTASFWTRTSIYPNSVSSLAADSPVDHLIPNGYEEHAGSWSPGLPATESTARVTLSTSDLANIRVATPEPVLQKDIAYLSGTRLQPTQRRSLPTYYMRLFADLPSPPRYTRSLVSRQSSIKTVTPQALNKEWSDADIRRGSVLSRVASRASAINQERSSFDFPYLPSPSGWPSRFITDFAFLPIEQSSMSDLHDALDALAASPSRTPPVAMSPYDGNSYEILSASPTAVTVSLRIRGLPKVPRNVDSNDFGSVPVSARRTSDTIREEFYSSVGTVTLGGLSPFAWAASVTDVTTSGGSSPAQPSAFSYDVDGRVPAVKEIIQSSRMDSLPGPPISARRV